MAYSLSTLQDRRGAPAKIIFIKYIFLHSGHLHNKSQMGNFDENLQ